MRHYAKMQTREVEKPKKRYHNLIESCCSYILQKLKREETCIILFMIRVFINSSCFAPLFAEWKYLARENGF
jgi:hypothetical protein